MRNLVWVAAVIIFSTSVAHSKKPDWPGKEGTGVVGFGLVELSPRQDGDKFVRTRFTFNYEVAAEHAKTLGSGQIAVFHAKAFSEANNIEGRTALTHTRAANLVHDTDFHMSAVIAIDQPGLYIVAYGPWDGLIIFDAPGSMQGYKISGHSVDGGQLKWIEEDAGDMTVMNYGAIAGLNREDIQFRMRIIRDKRMLLHNTDLYRFQPFKLHPLAQGRVDLLEAKW